MVSANFLRYKITGDVFLAKNKVEKEFRAFATRKSDFSSSIEFILLAVDHLIEDLRVTLTPQGDLIGRRVHVGSGARKVSIYINIGKKSGIKRRVSATVNRLTASEKFLLKIPP